MKDTFLLVDGNSLMHRAYHALPLMDADGIYTNAIYGFFSMLLKVIREEKVQYLAVCFDEHAPTFRHTIYPEYKAGRSETPPELRQQFDTIRTLLDDLKIRRFSLQGWEADDLLGTLSLLGAEAGAAPLLLTGDRDALQLVGNGTELMFTRKGISETIRFDPSKVYEEYGITPGQVTDWKGLAGDSSDNIPGVPGVGDKTAVKLLQEYGTLENVLENAGSIKGKLGEKLATFSDQARFCKDLATIRRDAPVEFTLDACVLPDLKQGIPALQKLKLFSLIKRINADEAGAAGETSDRLGDEPSLPFNCIEFLSVEELTELNDIRAWITQHVSENVPLCLWAGETSMSLAVQDEETKGSMARISLGGDLLTPGLDPTEVLRVLGETLRKGNAAVHDGKAWLKRLENAGAELPEQFFWDTMLGAYLLNPQEKSYRLGALCPDLPEDAGTLCSLQAWQRKQVEADGMMTLMTEIEMPLSFVLYRMEKVGFAVDTAFLRELGDKYTAEITQRRNEVIEATGGTPFNVNSPQQLGEILLKRCILLTERKPAKAGRLPRKCWKGCGGTRRR